MIFLLIKLVHNLSTKFVLKQNSILSSTNYVIWLKQLIGMVPWEDILTD